MKPTFENIIIIIIDYLQLRNAFKISPSGKTPIKSFVEIRLPLLFFLIEKTIYRVQSCKQKVKPRLFILYIGYSLIDKKIAKGFIHLNIPLTA